MLLYDHPEVIVEVGVGYGANFRYMKTGTKVIAIEPNADMRDILRARAEKFGIELEIHELGAENIPIESNCVDMVLGSLVLCSVKNPPKVLSEVKRILRPGGKFVFVEHVRAHKNSWICKVQRMVKGSWKWFFEGCNVTRDTGRIIQLAGFSEVNQDVFAQRTIFVPIIPHIAGVAIK